jgi:hypothetical protein
METKICSKCKEEKIVDCFYKDKTRKDGFRSRCKKCCLIESYDYENRNPNVVKNKTLKYRKNNQDKVKLANKEWREKNENYIKKRMKLWRDNNKNHIKTYKKNKYNNDFLHKLTENVRCRINTFLNRKNIIKKNKTFDVVGCSPQFLKEYLENKFTDDMTWDNYGFYGWHIDHIIPLSSSKTEEEIYKLCHYSNLQPLWAIDNLKKGSKIL